MYVTRNKPVQANRNPFSVFPLLFPTLLFLWAGCSEKERITEVNFEEADFSPFVEPDFPFITTSMDGRNLGPGFPKSNIASRVLALRLGEDAFVGFDTDMLRWSVAWTGDFMPMVTMAQISYRDFHNKDNELPVIGGEPKIATGLYPGWSGPNPDFTDPRAPSPHPDSPSWGALPVEVGRWNGVYLAGEEVVFSYTVKNTDIYEKPGSVKAEEEVGFIRTIQIEEPREALSMVAAEVSDGFRTKISGKTAYIYHGDQEKKVTAIGLAGEAPGVEIEVIKNRYAVLQLSPSEEELNFSVAIWQGSVEKKHLFEQMLPQVQTEMPDFRNGGPAYWKEEVLTQGQLAPDTAAFVTDLLTLPIPNPWKRNVRVVDVAFLDEDRAALVTFEGDVWLVEGIDRELDKLRWRRFASGLYEPQSIEVVKEKIYVYGKEGIVRFHDLNGDGVADFYENFSNLMAQSIETREWASDMVAAPDGSFFVAKFGALDMGPETSSPKSLMGFRAASHHDGSILKISPDGRSIQTYASGFRGPYLGMNPETGVLSASDQQGHYMPSTPVMLIDQGDYYGVPATAHRDPVPEITPPLVWIPHSVDRSGISQVWINSDQMGPLNGEMVHLSYGRPGLFRIMIDSTEHGVQGGVSVLKGHYPAPTMKGVINPGDGLLYVTGFSLWGSNSSTISAFSRIRYTGEKSDLPEKFYVRDGGVVIRFERELDEASATDPKNFFVKRWNYLRSEKYGSGHYKPDGTVGEEYLPVLGSYLSDDRKALFLAVPNIEEVMQMEVSYHVKSADGSPMEDVLWLTINEVAPLDLLAEGFVDIDVKDINYGQDASLTVEDQGEKPSREQGEKLFLKMGCVACHAIDNKTEGKIGPGMYGMFNTERHFKDGSSAIADGEYIRESIISPAEKMVKGHEEEMPSFIGVLTENEIESLILYIKMLGD